MRQRWMMKKIVAIVGFVAIFSFLSIEMWLYDLNNNPPLAQALSAVDNFDTNKQILNSKIYPQTIDQPDSLTTIDIIKPLDAYIDQIPDDGGFIVIDLGTEDLMLYQDGELDFRTKFKSQGEFGSFWQTPTGYYEISYANRNHRSSIGNVDMPYSLQFSGNFFIHGWPTNPDGTPVPEGFSGGCVRLSTSDAKTVFESSPVGTKVLVVNSNTVQTDQINHPNLENWQTTAPSYLVANLKTGQVYQGQNYRNQPFPLGSISNFILAIKTNEWISYNSQIPLYATSNNKFYQTTQTQTPKEIYPNLLNLDQQADALNLSVSNYHGRGFGISKTTTKHQSIGMDETKLISSVNELEPLRFSGPLDEWFHLIRYLHFQKPFLLETATGIDQLTKGLKVFTTSTAEDTLSGFAIAIDDSNDPVVYLAFDDPNFVNNASQLKALLDQLPN
jgi:lipoprotein-anchoring transpeptidase ErfK/SrfK